MIKGEGRNIDWQSPFDFLLTTTDATYSHLLISSILPPLMNRILRILNSSTWGRTSFPFQRGYSTLFSLRIKLILILAFHTWLQTGLGRAGDGHLQKAEVEFWGLQTRPLPPFGCAKKLSIKVMNRIIISFCLRITIERLWCESCSVTQHSHLSSHLSIHP